MEMSGLRVRTQIAFVAAALLVMTVAVTAQGAEARTVKVVRGVGTSWSPRVIRIASGTSIRWKAVSNSHTVTAYGGHWTFNRSLPQGSSIQRRFKTQGTFLFRCRIHSQLVNGVCQGMCGKVVVGAAAGSIEVNTGTASGVGTVLVERDGTHALRARYGGGWTDHVHRCMPERLAAALAARRVWRLRRPGPA